MPVPATLPWAKRMPPPTRKEERDEIAPEKLTGWLGKRDGLAGVLSFQMPRDLTAAAPGPERERR